MAKTDFTTVSQYIATHSKPVQAHCSLYPSTSGVVASLEPYEIRKGTIRFPLSLSQLWLFWVAPIAGAAIGALTYSRLFSEEPAKNQSFSRSSRLPRPTL